MSALLLSRDHLLRYGSVRIVFVWVVDLDPVPTVIRAVWSIEIAAMFFNHEVHTLRSLVVSFDELLPFALTKTHVVLLIQDTRLIKPRFVTFLIDDDQPRFFLRHEEFATLVNELAGPGIMFLDPCFILAV